MSIAADFTRHLARLLAIGGTDGTLLYQDDPTGPGVPIRFALNHPLTRDDAIVNAYGVNALVLTIPVSPALLAKPPRKFDVVRVKHAKPYVLDAVKLHQVDNTGVAFTGYVKGKGE